MPAGYRGGISVLLPTGAVEERQVGSLSGRTVGVTSAFSTAPQAGAIWVLASTQRRSRNCSGWFRLPRREPGIHEVTALAHNPDKYGAIEQGLALQPRDITVLSEHACSAHGLAWSPRACTESRTRPSCSSRWAGSRSSARWSTRLSYRVNGGNTVSLAPGLELQYLEIRNAAGWGLCVHGEGGGSVRQARSLGHPERTAILGKTAAPGRCAGLCGPAPHDRFDAELERQHRCRLGRATRFA